MLGHVGKIYELHGLVGGGKRGKDDIDIIQTLPVPSGKSITKGDIVEFEYGVATSVVTAKKVVYTMSPTNYAIPMQNSSGVRMCPVGTIGSAQSRDIVLIAYAKTSTSIGLKALRYENDGTITEGTEYVLASWSLDHRFDMAKESNQKAFAVGVKGENFIGAVIVVDGSTLALTITESGVSSYTPTSIIQGRFVMARANSYIYAFRNSSGYAVAMAIYVSGTNVYFSSSVYTIHSGYTTFQWAKGAHYRNFVALVVFSTNTASNSVFAAVTHVGTTSPTLTITATTVHNTGLNIQNSTFAVVPSRITDVDTPNMDMWIVTRHAGQDVRALKATYNGSTFVIDPLANTKTIQGVYTNGDPTQSIEAVNVMTEGEYFGGFSANPHVVIGFYSGVSVSYFLVNFANIVYDPLIPFSKNQSLTPEVAPISKHAIHYSATFQARPQPLAITGYIGGDGYRQGGMRVVDANCVSPWSSLALITMGIPRDRSYISNVVPYNDPKPIGIALESNNGTSCKVQLRGIVKGHILVPGSKYYADGNGKLTRKKTRNLIGISISSTELLIRKSALIDGVIK